MQTCSNCGATSREGAKFCTTCGSRLNPVTDPAVNGWGSVPAAEPESGSPATPEPATPASDTSQQEETFTTGWSWGQSSASTQSNDTPASTTPAPEEAPESPADDDAPTLSAWAMQWDSPASDAASNDDDTTGASAPLAEEVTVRTEDPAIAAEDVSERADDSDATGEPDPVDRTDADNADDLVSRANAFSAAVAGFDTDENDAETAPEPVIALPVAASASDAPAAIDDAGAGAADTPTSDEPEALTGEATAPIAVDADGIATPGSETPVRQQAHALLDALRSLFDEQAAELARTPEPEPAPMTNGPSGDTQAALATLRAVQGDGDRFENLRGILEKAREHPRDVDTMLDLLGEINSLIALVDSHESRARAVDAAIEQLEHA